MQFRNSSASSGFKSFGSTYWFSASRTVLRNSALVIFERAAPITREPDGI